MSTHRHHHVLRLGAVVACVLLSACTGMQEQQASRDGAGMPPPQSMNQGQMMGQGQMMSQGQMMGQGQMTGGGAMMGQGQAASGQMPPMAQMRMMPADPALVCAMHADVSSARTPEERREKMNRLFHGMAPEMQEPHYRMLESQCKGRRTVQ